MYLNAFDTNLVVSVAVQTLKSGKMVANVYYDSKPRTYEDMNANGLARSKRNASNEQK